MKHIFVEKHEQLINILSRFFKSDLKRNSHTKRLENEEEEVFELACKIYKRGLDSRLRENDDGSALSSRGEYTGSRLSSRGEPTGSRLSSRGEPTGDAAGSIFYLVDENFIKHHPIFNNYYSYLPKESTKNMFTVKELITKIPEQTAAIYVAGGGITLDIGGFIAGLLGLPVHYLATTFLAAVDAAVGGKTGVNFSPYGKNQIGLFYQANSLSFEAKYLSTLDQQEILCGAVEAIKHAYLFGNLAQDLPLLEKIIVSPRDDKWEQDLSIIVKKNFQYKSTVVGLDLLEKNGIRSSLNFGHTLAHVLEALAEEGYIDDIPHGIAVAHGLLFLSLFNLAKIPNEMLSFLNKILTNYRVIIKKHFNSDVIVQLLSQDKKNNSQHDCELSLPKYGVFSKKEKRVDIIKTFSIRNVASWMQDYIQGS